MGLMHRSLHGLSRVNFISDKKKLEYFPPFFLMRIKVLDLGDNWNHIRIKLPLNWRSANAAGNMFGGYQASLADPIPALACLKLFPGYRVATKSLAVNFLLVGNSNLTLHFDFDDQLKQTIENDLAERGRSTPTFTMTLVREDGKVCTQITNTVAIRPKGYITPLDQE